MKDDDVFVVDEGIPQEIETPLETHHYSMNLGVYFQVETQSQSARSPRSQASHRFSDVVCQRVTCSEVEVLQQNSLGKNM